jgi:CheY-like chemotaxis protein
MPRPTILVAEPDPVQALSVRKLVIETAKFNVITAHSTEEAIDLFHIFPNVDAVVLVDSREVDCDVVGESIKGNRNGNRNKVPIILLSPRIGAKCDYADHHLSSHEPGELLELIREMLGDPRVVK